MTDKKPTKILVAEDDKFLSKIYSEKLKELGYQVFIAMDGDEAIAIIKRDKPNLVLLDLIMPKKNGFEVLEEINKTAALKKIPVIVASNLGQESDIEKAKNLGAVDYLIKADTSFDDILKKIEKYSSK